MRVLCLHGIGRQEVTASVWQPLWAAAIAGGLHAVDPSHPAPSVDFVPYDDLFAGPLSRLSYADFARAFWDLASGALARPRALLDFSDSTRWYAGMVAVWVESEDLRARLRQRLGQYITRVRPDVVCAHSLGSLIAYDMFAHDDAGIAGRAFVTLGSQIGNRFVRGGAFAGRLEPIARAARWYHLYNPRDHVFTAPLDFGAFLTAENFRQVVTQFGAAVSGFAANHSAVNAGDPDDAYLTHPQTRQVVWPQIAAGPSARALAAPRKAVRQVAAQAVPDRRALLVGNNGDGRRVERLEGCVNDVFLVSTALQECGFDAEDIRVVLDDRATADGIRERLHWLLDGADANDTRFFYYSGHGAQLPVYGPRGQVDRVAACLVPYDFAWTPETAVTDRDLVDLYSQLPYEARFMMVLDCCYAGGMTRGGTRARGLEPPDDIRHRMLRWDAGREMWVFRDLPPLNPDLSKRTAGPAYVGEAGATLRLGRGVSLRVVTDREYNRTRKELGHKGPFMPVVYEACGEAEFAYEYQHGATSYGAFTYAVVTALRRRGRVDQQVSFADLLKQTARTLRELRYDQHPEAAGPKEVLGALVPWQSARGRSRGAGGRRRETAVSP